MPKKEEKQTPGTFGRILDAATDLFLEAGFASTSTSAIASRAKVSKRELYTQFGDKRAVLHAAITRLQEEIALEMSAEWADEGELSTVLQHAGTTLHRHITSKRFRQLFRIVAAESFQDPVSAKQFYKLGPGRGRVDTSRYLATKMKAGLLREDDPLRAADIFLDLVIGARTMTATALGITESTGATKKQIEHAVGLFLRCYGKEPAARKRRS